MINFNRNDPPGGLLETLGEFLVSSETELSAQEVNKITSWCTSKLVSLALEMKLDPEEVFAAKTPISVSKREEEPEVRLQIVLRKQVGKLIGALKKIPVPSVAPAGGANPGGINSGGKALRFSSTGPGSSQNLAFTGSMSASG